MTIITVGEPTAVSGNFVHWSTYGEAITNGGSGMTSQGYVRQSTATNNPTVSLSYSADAWATRSQLAYGVASGGKYCEVACYRLCVQSVSAEFSFA